MSIAGLSALGGGLLGQLGDVASSPRRGLWAMLGLPEHGSELVSNVTGMDPESSLAHALGIGAEIAGDPLNLFAPILGRLGTLASRVGPKYRGLLAEAKGAGQEFTAADRLLDAERAAMANRYQDITDIGQGAMQQAEMDVGGRAARAKDAMMPPMAGESFPRKMMGLEDPRLGSYQAYGLADVHPDDLSRAAIVPGLQEARAGAGRGGRHVGFADVPAYETPPGADFMRYGPRGFGPDMQSGFMNALDTRQQSAKNALMEALMGVDSYAIPALGPWEEKMLGAGFGALGAPPLKAVMDRTFGWDSKQGR